MEDSLWHPGDLRFREHCSRAMRRSLVGEEPLPGWLALPVRLAIVEGNVTRFWNHNCIQLLPCFTFSFSLIWGRELKSHKGIVSRDTKLAVQSCREQGGDEITENRIKSHPGGMLVE